MENRDREYRGGINRVDTGHEGGSGTINSIGDGEREGDKCDDNNTGSEVHPQGEQ